MLHFFMKDGRAVEARQLTNAEYQGITSRGEWLPRHYPDSSQARAHERSGWFCRWEIGSRYEAERIAMDLNIAAMKPGEAGVRYIATDCGPNVSPRFDVIEVPAQGDKVSRYFNGDSYPAGTIKSISESLRRIETTDGTVFWRRQNSGSWVANGTWSMIDGHHEDRNPHF